MTQPDDFNLLMVIFLWRTTPMQHFDDPAYDKAVDAAFSALDAEQIAYVEKVFCI